MNATVADLNPKTLESAKRQFVELYGSALVHEHVPQDRAGPRLPGGLGTARPQLPHGREVLPGQAAGHPNRRVGRAEAVQYDAAGYQPQAPELRYFLTQFIVKHFSRLRATVQREYPDSLFFLEPALADATIAQNEQSRVLETFLTNPSADEVDIVVQNVSLSELAKPPYKASVSFQKVLYTPGTRQERARQTFIAQIDFVAARPRAERVRSRESARSSGQLLPRRSGVRGGQAMIANVAFLAALTTFLAVAWLAGELSFLAPYKAGIFRHHGLTIGLAVLVLFLNLCAAYYGIARWLFLRDTGRKLSHMDRQLGSRDAVLRDLHRDLKV